jgi:ABC-type uncharacterized transport system substrate-binding protein
MRSSASLRHCDIAPWPSKAGDKTKPNGVVTEGAGCLFSYSVSLKDMWYRSATYVDKILKGAKPSDLPVQQGTKFEWVINLKTAKPGLDVPATLLARADEVIE